MMPDGGGDGTDCVHRAPPRRGAKAQGRRLPTPNRPNLYGGTRHPASEAGIQ